jgi:hypothetical protein
MEKISWTDGVRNEVFHRVREERNIVHTIKRRKANWIGHILRRDCLPAYSSCDWHNKQSVFLSRSINDFSLQRTWYVSCEVRN